jgi:hypothetical protein
MHMEDQTRRRIVNGALFGAVALAVVIVGAAAYNAWVVKSPPPAPAIVQAPPPALPPRIESPPVPPIVFPIPVPPAPAIAPPPATPDVVAPPPVVRPVPAPAAIPEVIAEPYARQALAYVGADPEAERVWVQAINDTANLSPNDRQNLIEDLNETGFDDPNNLTPNDLPLINARLDLIDALYQDAADDTNAAAFDEAYKDLLNMRARLMGP